MSLLPHDQPVLAIIGPSGTGKTTIIRRLTKDGLFELTPTWTDRPPRPGEEALEHRFVTSAEFDKLVAKGFFIHPPQTFFNLPYRYAMPKLSVPPAGKVPVIMARIMALKLLDKYYPNRIIYQIEAPFGQVVKRLKKRADEGVELGSRLDDYISETELGRISADRTFINDDSIETVTDQVAAFARQDFNIAQDRLANVYSQ